MQNVLNQKPSRLLKGNLAFLIEEGGEMQKLKRIQMLWAGIILISSLTLVGIPYAQGDTWYVKTGGSNTNGGTSWEDSFQTIQRGIDEAENGDTVLVADGTYTGPGNKNIELQGKTITVKSLNGPENCVIDCENSDRGFYIHQGEGRDTVVSGFTIKNGNVSDHGGAIYCTYASSTVSSTATIDNCIIKNNIASFGGGISCVYAGATVTNCQIINNTSNYGGGIYSLFPWRATDNLIIINCTIAGNTANYNGNGQGGGILFIQPFGGAYLTVTNSTIAGNMADDGGGIFLSTCADEIIINTILWENTPDNISVNNCSPVVTYTAGSGYAGEGNTEEAPLFISVTDPDPLNWNLRQQLESPCIDAGDNLTPDLPATDLDSKPRRIDGDGNLTIVVDMGAYEYGDICECDYLEDLDTDGADLAEYINDNRGQDLSILAGDYGRINCPKYEFTP